MGKLMAVQLEFNQKKRMVPVIQFRWALLIAAFLFFGRVVFTALIRDPDLLSVTSNAYMILEGLAAASATFYAARYTAIHSRQHVKTWTFLLLGIVCMILGNAIWAILMLVYDQAPTPSIADFFFILFYVFVWFGLYFYPLSSQRGSVYKYLWLDNIVVFLGSGLFFWHILISPMLQMEGGSLARLTINNVYPILDMILLWSLLAFFRNRPEQSSYPPILFIGLCLLTILTADSLFAYQSVFGAYTGGSVTDIVWAIGFNCGLLSAIAQVNALSQPPQPPHESEAPNHPRQTWPVYLPYIWMIVACVLLFFNGTTISQDPEEYIVVGAIIILVVFRQVLTLRDNESLYLKAQGQLAERIQAQAELRKTHDDLEERVRERTADLLNANQEMRVQMAERERVEQTLRYRAEIDKIMASVSASFIRTTAVDIDANIQHALVLLGKFAGADRCYLIQYSQDGTTFSGTYEWTAEGVQGHIQALQNIPVSAAPWWAEKLSRFEIIHMVDPEQLPPEASQEKSILQRFQIKSALVVPLMAENKVIGFIGFDGPQEKKGFSGEEIGLLRTVSAILSNALHRTSLHNQLQEHVRQVEESLAEKNVLLKEIHHRVKNNLQIVSSLLSMQARGIQDPMALSALRNSQTRVRSMALIHERLYQSDNLGQIRFGPYINDLAAFLFRSYQDQSGLVRLKTEIEETALDIDAAVPLGLILNELITNSLKYAFPAGRSGEIFIRLFHPTEAVLCLVCEDDGVGLPPGKDLHESQTLGMQLIYSLTSQLDGEIEIESQAGLKVSILFPCKKCENEPAAPSLKGPSNEDVTA
jgi:two-component system, sensor histidine kinase PdtaS